ncbi:hypothetical protein JXL83_01300 [candidate division WOR-3 bacterium]|nr:hypothetical protein [candidate division WOR-3 bacterium]
MLIIVCHVFFPEENKFSGFSYGGEANSTGFDVIKYELDLEFFEPFDSLEGKCRMKSIAMRRLSSAEFHLGTKMRIDSVIFQELNQANFSRTGDTVNLHFPNPVDSGVAFEITTYYCGRPEFGLYQAFGGFFTDVEVLQASKQWWPCVDFCGEKADSGINVSITVPSALYAVSNGNLASIDTVYGQKLKYRWEHNYPIATYLVAVMCSDYTLLEKNTDAGNLIYYSIKGHENLAQLMLDSSEIIIGFFESIIAPHPFSKEKIGQCQSGGRGAMENQTCIRYSPGSWSATLVHAHEIAHTWWGNAVTCSDYSEMFINEGTASYYELLAAYEIRGEAAFRERLLYMRESALNWDDNYHWPIIGSPNPFGLNVYWKGAWFYRMLREIVGDSVFFLSMKNFYDCHIWKNASSEDLLAAFENTSGENLAWFFDQWLRGVDYPCLYFRWNVECDSLKILISQFSWSGKIYRLPLEIAVWKNNEIYCSYETWIESDSELINLGIINPDSITLDPDDKLFFRKIPVLREETAEFEIPMIFRRHGTSGFTAFSFLYDGSIFVYDVSGRKVFSKCISPGEAFFWQGTTSSGSTLPDGVYFVKTDDEAFHLSILILK